MREGGIEGEETEEEDKQPGKGEDEKGTERNCKGRGSEVGAEEAAGNWCRGRGCNREGVEEGRGEMRRT